jgi:phage-related protein
MSESQLGVAVVPIRATLEKLDGDLSEAQKKIDSALGRTVDRIKTDYLNLGGKVATGVGLATSALVGLGAAGAGVLSRLAVDALPLQGVQDAFAGITGNADEMLEVLQRGSLGMVRDTDLMMSYNSAAQLVSKTFADQLPDAMGYLAKVSAATGEDMGFMIDSLVKGVGRLSPMILDNLGIQVQLSDATARAAEMFGVEEDALTKTQIQAGMMDVVLQKLAENTADMPEVAGTARQRWAAFGVTMQNFKDRVGVALIPILERLLTPLADLAERVLPVVAEKAAWLAERIGWLIDVIAEAGLISTKTQEVLGAIIGEEAAAKVMEFLATVQSLAATISAFVSEHAEELKAALIAIGAVLASAGIAAAITAIAGAIGALFSPLTLIIAAVALLAAAWTGNWGGIQEKTQAVIDFIQPYIETAITFIRELINSTLNAIRGWWDAHGAEVMATISHLWENAKQRFNAALEFIKRIVDTALGVIRLWWSAWGDSITTIINSAWETIKRLFNNALQMIQATVRMFLATLRGDWTTAGEQLRVIVDKAWDSIKAVFEHAWTVLKATVEGIVESIKAGFEIDWGAVGSAVIDGIKNGISSAAGKIADAARQAAKNALDAAKGFLGISSPSKVAMREIGVPFVQGIGRGLEQAMGQLARTTLPELSMQLVDIPRRDLARPSEAQSNEYHLHIHSSASVENLPGDFAMLQAMAGA